MPGPKNRLAAVFLTCLLFAPVTAAQATETQDFNSDDYALRIVTVASGLRHPWGMAFLPDDRMIVTEREGDIRIVAMNGNKSQPLKGVPDAYIRGQGGVLDVALDPAFSENSRVYVSFSEPGPGGAGTAVLRATLDLAGEALTDGEIIFRQEPKTDGGRHFGSRLVFAPDGTLFITVGERGERDRTQDFTINRGQVVRINPDGTIPTDNPFIGVAGRRPEVWSYGHRNPQGAALHPQTGRLWTVEHGARGGDEINLPEAGKNYGWPVISYGRHYSGGKIGDGTHKSGYEQPLYYWDPSIAPSGMAFYTGDVFPQWRGDLFVGSLKFGLLVRLDMDGTRITAEERLLEGLDDRVRDVRQGPDGMIYLLTDDYDGRILRLEPR
ncbi:PQQ-dependent sugar dehydrogenase [Hwanghaeella grinnelliae]|uniref:PQQ-dependent sugar dehydrogenase n=1 Tax=Hwanghaeella grinnelliae TaxID=2500179 RepID=A0A3S2Z5X6_9PROT|nr:PQQ-dependent sugar dehydrogenase [Hwanghaeella grinnelliae]RVU33822.1 PQQ-dependent sugar dehydrogenase [Hwanghaeella grinnelliae]